MSGNLNIPAQQWLEEQFEYEYCSECGGDADDHIAVPVMGNWFARCNHPLSDALLDGPDEAIEKELVKRHRRQECGLPMASNEHFDHEDCPECGSVSVPCEHIPDQTLRGCPKCEHTWFENLETETG